VSISTDRLAVLRDQLGLTWQLAEVVLADVSDRECLWLPSERSWTVRRDDEGRWIPDWQQPEPADVAQPSLAWTMWQTIWWWSVLLDQLRGDGTLRREDIAWPGAEAGVVTLRELYGRWDAFLAGLGEADLDSGELTGFPSTTTGRSCRSSRGPPLSRPRTSPRWASSGGSPATPPPRRTRLCPDAFGGGTTGGRCVLDQYLPRDP
jgi:DinB superfamily